MMTWLKIIQAKLTFIIFCLIVAATVYVLTSSLTFSLATFVAVFLLIYWRLIGPMHLATKNEIKALIDSGLFYDTEIKPYSEFGKSLINNQLNSVIGQGMIGRFSDSYVTFSMKDGIYVYNLNIPYMTIFKISWGNIVSMKKKTESIIENKLSDKDTYEIQLSNGKSIFLPILDDMITMWKEGN